MENFTRYKIAMDIAIKALIANGLRSILTALGIIFGVAAVIAMLAIGEGAKKEIMDQIKMVGVNNIVVEKIVPDENSSSNSGKDKYSPGLSVLDADAISESITSVRYVSPVIEHKSFASANGTGMDVLLKGVSIEFFEMFNYDLIQGEEFSSVQEKNGAPVCVIGSSIAAKLFSGKDPIGQSVKCNHLILQVIGVFNLDNSFEGKENKGIKDRNAEILTPFSTTLLRYKNPTMINEVILKAANDNDDDDEDSKPKVNDPHQVDKIIVQVTETAQLSATGEILSRFLHRRHKKVTDFSIQIPELLLKQQQKSKDIFNFVLGAIAAISLLVGGIGIMNIMLASVMERIREIGLRISLGATKKDVVNQFLFESMFLSIGGGLIGIMLGLLFSYLVTYFTGILTIVTFLSVFISFGVSGAVGLIFGLMPAKKAAEQNPVNSLRN